MNKKQEMELDYLYFLLEINKSLDKTPENIKNMKAVQLDIQLTKKLIKQRYLPFSFNQYNSILRLVKKVLPKEETRHLKEMNLSNENQVLNAQFEKIEGKNKIYTIELLGLDPLPYSSRVQEAEVAKSLNYDATTHNEASPIADFDNKSISQNKPKSQGIKPKPKSKSNDFEREM